MALHAFLYRCKIRRRSYRRDARRRSINYREHIARNSIGLCVRVISHSCRATSANEGYTDVRIVRIHGTYVYKAPATKYPRMTNLRLCLVDRSLWPGHVTTLTRRVPAFFAFPNEDENVEGPDGVGRGIDAERRRISVRTHTPLGNA